MITVKISYDVSEEKILKIREMLDRELITNVNFCGADFEIERDDFTEIDSDDGSDPSLVNLLHKIFRIIEGSSDAIRFEEDEQTPIMFKT